MPNTAKQEAIRKAYGEYWETYSVDEDGYSSIDNSNFYPNVDWHPNKHHLWRPKSLQGIENNRGWIRIESEEDLPLLEDESEFWIANENGIFDFTAYSLQVQRKWENKTLTHYQKVVKPEKPIY